jgi:hypothetical protein
VTQPDEDMNREGVPPGHAAPMEWTLVTNPNEQRGMTSEEVERFLDRPITGMGPLRSEKTREESNG